MMWPCPHRELPVAATLFVLLGCAAENADRLAAPAPTMQRVEAQLNLARGYLASNDLVRARGPLLRALELAPDSLEAHVLAAALYERQGERELAEHHYQSALAINPKNAQALNNYGAYLYAQGRVQAAIDPLRQAAEDSGYRRRAQAFENLGLAELGLGRVNNAKHAFQRALNLGGQQPRSSLELATILFTEQDYTAAERHYHDFHEQLGDTARSLCLGLRLGSVQDATERAQDHAASLAAKFPEAVEACR